MNKISILCSAEGFEVSAVSTELSFDDLEARVVSLLDRVGPGQKESPEHYHN